MFKGSLGSCAAIHGQTGRNHQIHCWHDSAASRTLTQLLQNMSCITSGKAATRETKYYFKMFERLQCRIGISLPHHSPLLRPLTPPLHVHLSAWLIIYL